MAIGAHAQEEPTAVAATGAAMADAGRAGRVLVVAAVFRFLLASTALNAATTERGSASDVTTERGSASGER